MNNIRLEDIQRHRVAFTVGALLASVIRVNKALEEFRESIEKWKEKINHAKHP